VTKNGTTNEEVLAMLIDRLECKGTQDFQADTSTNRKA